MSTKVTYSVTQVVRLAEYESVHIHAGVESDVKAGETVQQAFDRCVISVENRVNKQVKEVRASLK